MRLVVITQSVDEDDPALGATVPMLRALAERVDELVVLALRAKPTELPANVRVKEFGAPTQALRGARLLAQLAPELRRRPVAVLAHMAPIYAVLASTVTRPLRVPLLLWFTHWRASRTLELAERVSTSVLSVNERSFPIPTTKLVATGHAVEIGAEVVPAGGDAPLKLLALGRTSRAKGLDTIVEAVESLDGAAVVELRGPSLTDEERRYRSELAARVDDVRIRLAEPVGRREIARVYGGADALVNNMRAGALDKVVFEAAAAALPVLVASDGFAALVDGLELPLRYRQDDAEELAERIRGLIAAGPEGRARIGRALRERVARDHSVGHWADEVVAAAR